MKFESNANGIGEDTAGQVDVDTALSERLYLDGQPQELDADSSST